MGFFFKKILTIAIICAIGYVFLGYHYIIVDKSVKMLKKSELTLKYTFFNTDGKKPEKVMSIPELWDDGIGELLMEEGVISEEELEKFRIEKEAEEEEYY